MAGYIRENLTRVRHSSVSCREAPEGTEITPRFEELSLNVASERADCVLAALWKLPRSEAQKLFASEKVFADGRVLADPGRTLKEESRISVRGFGKFIYGGTEGKSRSGRLFVHIRRFV
jgi:RNA-binding protein YlmH